MLGAEKPLCPIDRELLRDVHVLAPTVPTFAWITFGILVSQHRALRFYHRATGKILGSDQFDILPLPIFFSADDIEDLGIDSSQRFAVDPLRRGAAAVNVMRKIAHW